MIDETDESILSNITTVKIRKNFTPILLTSSKYFIYFRNALYNPHSGHLASTGGILSSTGFKIDGNDVIQISASGLKYLLSVNQKIQSAFDDNSSTLVTGKVFSGLGEGAYYISLSGYKKQFISKLGYEPYPGTLNLKLSSNLHKQFIENLSNMEGVIIEGFTDKKRTYGNVICYPSMIDSNIQGSVILIERTHHDSSGVELISPTFLRKKLKLKDGDEVKVNISV